MSTPRWLLLAALVGLSACGRSQVRHYYTLGYPIPPKRFATPHPQTVRVRDLDIRESYRRPELVFRRDAHEIQYERSRRWSEAPQKMIGALVRDHLRASGLVATVTEDIGQTLPDFTLEGDIQALEELAAGRERFARLAITFRLVRFADDQVVWRHTFDERRPVSRDAVRGVVRTLSQILALETEKALEDLDRYFRDPDAVPVAPEVDVAEADAVPPMGPELEIVGPDPGAESNYDPQVLADDTPIPVGYGAIFLPALSEGDREPPAAVFDGDKVIAEGPMGRRLVVEPGTYDVRIGTGTVEQQPLVHVRVEAGRTTVVPPSWSALEIEVVDAQFVPFRGTYEIIRADTREDFGLGLGADQQLGEELRVWVLDPGLYKIIRAGGTYRDRTDFSTVRLEPGRLTHFTLVQDPVDGTFKGAGETDPEQVERMADSNWLLRALIGGDMAFNRTNEVGRTEGWELGLTFFFDSSAHYNDGANIWNTRLEIEEGQLRPADTKEFENVTDRLFFHTIYIHNVVPWFGPYVRFGVDNTSLLPRDTAIEGLRFVEEVDEDGDRVRGPDEVRRVEVGGTFSPLPLKEGAGGNFRILRNRAAELDLRLGFGGRQTLANGLLVYERRAGDRANPDRLVPVQDNTIEGAEGTVVGLGRVSRWVVLTTEFDGLLPFAADDQAVFTWRNQVSLRLITYISLNYRFNMTQDPNIGIGDEPRTEHDVQLRFSYNLL